MSPTLYIITVYRVNLNKLSRKFVGVLRTTTTNCRVSFIDLYLVFLRNFGIVFLPHTNTVILLELYLGTITEPGLPVVLPAIKGRYVFFIGGGGPGLRRGGSLVIFLQIGEGQTCFILNWGRATVFLTRKKLLHVASILYIRAKLPVKINLNY